MGLDLLESETPLYVPKCDGEVCSFTLGDDKELFFTIVGCVKLPESQELVSS